VGSLVLALIFDAGSGGPAFLIRVAPVAKGVSCQLYSRFAAKLPPLPISGHRHRRPCRRRLVSIAFAGLRREVLLELALFAFMLVGVGGRILLLGNVGPLGRVLRVEFEPL